MTYLRAGMAQMRLNTTRIAEDLADNVVKPAYCHDTVRLAWDCGARLASIVPRGTVLTSLTAPVLTGGQTISCENTNLDTMQVLMARGR